MSTPALRLGAVPYLNVAPMVHGLAGAPGVSLVRDVPARLLARLRAGEIDLGTVPSIDYASGGLQIVPGIAIGSRGPVRSVRLLHRLPLERIRRIAVDSSSHTSVALLRILLHGRLGREPEYLTRPPDIRSMLESADAALVIGDTALFAGGDWPGLDLGAEWTAQTGLPFVYAFWMARPDCLTSAVSRRLQAVLRTGLAAIPAIASAYSDRGPGARDVAESYLRESVSYRFDREEQEGLVEFYRRSLALGIIDHVPELSFHGDC